MKCEEEENECTGFKSLKNSKSPGKENYRKIIRNIYQKKDIYPFGPPTLSKQKKKKEKNKKITMDEKIGRVLGKQFKK